MVHIHLKFRPDGSLCFADPGEARPNGLVYFLRSGSSNHIKIGKSGRTQFPGRFRCLQGGNPKTLWLIGICWTSTPTRLDAYMKRHFAPYRRGTSEWFTLPDAMIAVLTAEEVPDGR